MGPGGAEHGTRETATPLSAWIGLLAAGAALSTLFSVFVSQVLGAAALTGWAVDSFRRGRLVWRAPASTWALAGFVGWSLVAVAASDEPGVSALYLKKHLRLLMLPLAATYLRLGLVRRWIPAFLVVLGASAAWGLLQYAGLKQVDLLNRIDGFMSHWMTFSAQLMLGGLLAAALLLFCRPSFRRTTALAGLGMLLGAALLLTMTRSAQLGAAAGLVVLLQLRFGWRAVAAFGGLLVVGVLLLPGPLQQRLASSFDLQDTTTRGRVDLLRTGANMVASHPLTGVGPRRVPEASARFRVEREAPETQYQHLHNNAVEIAASMGLPALGFWVLWWTWLTVELLRRWRLAVEPRGRALAAAALASVAAFQLAGLFEYNFGDAEVLMLALFLVTLPMARE